MSAKEFGEKLRYYRRKTNDPDRGGRLTQARLAALLPERLDRPTYQGKDVSYWENGKRTIKQQDRVLLADIIQIFHANGGLVSLDQANELLFAGGYRNLNDDEIQSVSSDWHKNKDVQPQNFSPASSASPFSPLAVFDRLNSFFEWTNADDHMRASWRGMVIHSLNSAQKKMPSTSLLRLILWFLLWIMTVMLVTSIFQWPLESQVVRLQAVVGYAIASLFIPLGIAFLTTADQEDNFILSTPKQRLTLLFLKLAGAYVGFNGLMPLLFLFVFVSYSLAERTLPALLIAFLVIVPLVWGHVGAGRIPTDRYKMYGGVLNTHPADKLFLFVFSILGLAIAVAIYFLYEPLLLYRSFGIMLILIIVAMIIWQMRQNTPQIIKDWQLILLIGVVVPTAIISLFMIEIFGIVEWPITLLVSTCFVMFCCLLITLFLRHPPVFTFQGTLFFIVIGIVLSMVAVLWWEGFWFVFGGICFLWWVIKKHLNKYLWVHTSFVFMGSLIIGALWVTVNAMVSLWLDLALFLILAIMLIIWAYNDPSQVI